MKGNLEDRLAKIEIDLVNALARIATQEHELQELRKRFVEIEEMPEHEPVSEPFDTSKLAMKGPGVE